MNQQRDIVINIRLNRGVIRRALLFGVIASVLVVPALIFGAQVGTLTSFSGGSPILASEVNGNFSAITSAVDDNDTRIAAMEPQVHTRYTNAEAVSAVQGLSIIKTGCYLTGYVNAWDSAMNYRCPNQGVMEGMYSIHDNGREDRIFRFYCCELQLSR